MEAAVHPAGAAVSLRSAAIDELIRPEGRSRGRAARVLSLNRPRSEAELIAAVKARDVAAFEVLMGQHKRLIWDVCARLTNSQQDAEDAVQAVQLAVWQGIGQFEGMSKFSTWLYRVAHNTTVGQHRRWVPEPAEIDLNEPAAGRDPGARVADGEAVRWALTKLPAEFRAALILKECFDLSLEEIAEIQIVSLGTVKSRLSRARQALAHLLEERDR